MYIMFYYKGPGIIVDLVLGKVKYIGPIRDLHNEYYGENDIPAKIVLYIKLSRLRLLLTPNKTPTTLSDNNTEA